MYSSVADGKIDRSEFFAALLGCSAEASKAAVDFYLTRKKLLENLSDAKAKFDSLDKDKSGFIEVNELGALKKLFNVTELDVGEKDGKIGIAEFFAALYDCHPADVKVAMERTSVAAKLNA